MTKNEMILASAWTAQQMGAITEEQVEAATRVASAIMDAWPSVGCSPWISVDHRLPKPWHVSIASAKGIKFSFPARVGLDGSWYDDRDEKVNVTHWMPMPEPPDEAK